MSKDFLGRGWKFPVQADPATGKIMLSEYEQDISESIRIILQTSRGERVMRPNFGAGLYDQVFESMSATTMGLVQAAVQDALLEWEPRIELQAVNVEPDHGEIGKLLIEIDYTVRATNTQFNLVFPFYLQENI